MILIIIFKICNYANFYLLLNCLIRSWHSSQLSETEEKVVEEIQFFVFRLSFFPRRSLADVCAQVLPLVDAAGDGGEGADDDDEGAARKEEEPKNVLCADDEKRFSKWGRDLKYPRNVREGENK